MLLCGKNLCESLKSASFVRQCRPTSIVTRFVKTGRITTLVDYK
jgi:hypothetical protein